MTRTYVKYFTDDSPGMPELAEAFAKISVDHLHRRDVLESKVAAALDRRIDNLRLAWALMLEDVP